MISHHYDLRTDFYALILDESMAYSCGWFPSGRPSPGNGADHGADPGAVLAAAQAAKFAFVGRDLALQPGIHLLDVGCGWGWGSMAIAAAATHGV
ncbi:SAM-dependent methyltransferase, partial [Dietzia sp.]|uniref:SAM-dependent methyltransferase n=1 Tax=Dietzia sp. TaxID=1871616 RepID=UPI002FD99337